MHLVVILGILPFALSAQNWDVVWEDEFDGTELDTSKWEYQVGNGTKYGLPDGWGNNELQYYREENVEVVDGVLKIHVKRQSYGGKGYTSARIRTKGKGDWTYGRIECRAKVPKGRGMWSAIWMLPTDEVYGGWAASGEIDIMENVGHEPTTVHGTLHFGGSWPNNAYKGAPYETTSWPFHQEFYDFALEWEEGEIRWYVNDQLYQTLGEGYWYSAGGPFPAPFDQDFHLLINVAVGGNWPGPPDGSTTFPQEMIVEYIRVYQKGPAAVSEEITGKVAGLQLLQNKPNPFAGITTIRYTTDTPGSITLDLFDAAGRKVECLVHGDHTPGIYKIEYDGSELPSGVYTCRLTRDGVSEVRRFVRL